MDCEFKDDLTALLDGELDAERAERVRAHIDECAECRDLVLFLKRSYDALDLVEAAPLPEGFTARVGSVARRRSRRSVFAAAAAALVIFAGLSIYWFGPGRSGVSTPVVPVAGLTAEELGAIENMDILENYDILSNLDVLAHYDTLQEMEEFPDMQAI